MAIAKLKKIYLIGHKTIEEIVVSKLHTLGVMQITDSREILSDLPRSEAKGFKDGNLDFQTGNINTEKIGQKENEDKLDKLQYIIKYIEKYIQPQGFLSKLTKGKFILSKDEFSEILSSFNLEEIFNAVRNLEKDIHNLNNKKARLKTQLFELVPWLQVDVKLDELSSTKKVNVISGIIKERNFSKFKEEISAKINYSHINQINTYTPKGTSKNLKYLVLFYVNDFKADLVELFRKYEFVEIVYPKIRATPARIARRINQELKYLGKKENELREESKKLAKYYIKLISLYDYYEEVKTKYQVRNYLVLTQDTFCLSGWIIAEEIEKIKQKLEQDFKQLEILVFDPGEKEQVPIILKNKNLVKPFEVITDLYGQPCYYELDPTPYLAPFFFLFWGMCITDAGYGIILMILSYIMIKKFKLGTTGKRFLNLIFLGGLSSVLWGALLGGWFGLKLEVLPPAFKILKTVRLFDPLDKPLLFFLIALSLGFIQVWSGIAVKMYEYIRLKKFREAFLDEFSWLILLLSILVFALNKFGIASDILTEAFIFLGIASALIIVLFKGRKTKSIFGRFFVGTFSLLGLFGFSGAVSYAGDIISYARLFALGLATGALAQAINASAKVAFSINFWVGIIMAPVIIIVGHLFNIAVNAFGGFIHSCRLQYVEFFTKFFEGGGKVFRPFKAERKYTIIK